MTPKQRYWKGMLRAAPVLVIAYPTIFLSERYLGPFWQWLVALGALVAILAYVHFLPKLPD